MAEEQRSIERQTARIASLKELNNGKYIKQEGWDPNYVLTSKDEKISRVNIIGVVVTIPESGQSLFIDDGSGKIEIRSFEEGNLFQDLTIGDIVLVIGRPRSYNEDIYLNAEIVKKITNKGWLEYRKKEILLKNIQMPDLKEEIKIETPVEEVPKEVPKPVEELDEIDTILMKIKELDKGEGCDVQELASNYPEAENIVQQLLLKGEIFEIVPGKVKILE